MAEIKLTIENDDSKVIFNNLVDSLTEEQKIEAVAKFFESTFNQNRDFWGKSVIQSKVETLIRESSLKYVEEHTKDLQDRIEGLYNFGTEESSKLDQIVKDSINDIISKAIGNMIANAFVNLNSFSPVYNQVRDALAQKGIFL